jgi:hypothetical protein
MRPVSGMTFTSAGAGSSAACRFRVRKGLRRSLSFGGFREGTFAYINADIGLTLTLVVCVS